MTHASFIHLRTHSSYPLSEGAIKADKIAVLAHDARMPAIAITDTANLFGALEFSQLSDGEKQRVAIARALTNAPALLRADEPTGSLDVATSKLVFEELLATHNPDLAARMDRRVTLQEGRIVEL